MPTYLSERNQPDRPSSGNEIAVMGLCCGVALVVLAGLCAYDARVITWVADAAQAEFVGPNPPAAAPPVKLAVRKSDIN